MITSWKANTSAGQPTAAQVKMLRQAKLCPPPMGPEAPGAAAAAPLRCVATPANSDEGGSLWDSDTISRTAGLGKGGPVVNVTRIVPTTAPRCGYLVGVGNKQAHALHGNTDTKRPLSLLRRDFFREGDTQSHLIPDGERPTSAGLLPSFLSPMPALERALRVMEPATWDGIAPPVLLGEAPFNGVGVHHLLLSSAAELAGSGHKDQLSVELCRSNLHSTLAVHSENALSISLQATAEQDRLARACRGLFPFLPPLAMNTAAVQLANVVDAEATYTALWVRLWSLGLAIASGDHFIGAAPALGPAAVWPPSDLMAQAAGDAFVQGISDAVTQRSPAVYLPGHLSRTRLTAGGLNALAAAASPHLNLAPLHGEQLPPGPAGVLPDPLRVVIYGGSTGRPEHPAWAGPDMAAWNNAMTWLFEVTQGDSEGLLRGLLVTASLMRFEGPEKTNLALPLNQRLTVVEDGFAARLRAFYGLVRCSALGIWDATILTDAPILAAARAAQDPPDLAWLAPLLHAPNALISLAAAAPTLDAFTSVLMDDDLCRLRAYLAAEDPSGAAVGVATPWVPGPAPPRSTMPIWAEYALGLSGTLALRTSSGLSSMKALSIGGSTRVVSPFTQFTPLSLLTRTYLLSMLVRAATDATLASHLHSRLTSDLLEGMMNTGNLDLDASLSRLGGATSPLDPRTLLQASMGVVQSLLGLGYSGDWFDISMATISQNPLRQPWVMPLCFPPQLRQAISPLLTMPGGAVQLSPSALQMIARATGPIPLNRNLSLDNISLLEVYGALSTVTALQGEVLMLALEYTYSDPDTSEFYRHLVPLPDICRARRSDTTRASLSMVSSNLWWAGLAAISSRLVMTGLLPAVRLADVVPTHEGPALGDFPLAPIQILNPTPLPDAQISSRQVALFRRLTPPPVPLPRPLNWTLQATHDYTTALFLAWSATKATSTLYSLPPICKVHYAPAGLSTVDPLIKIWAGMGGVPAYVNRLMVPPKASTLTPSPPTEPPSTPVLHVPEGPGPASTSAQPPEPRDFGDRPP